METAPVSLTHRIARDSLAVTAFVLLGRSFGLLVPLFVSRWFGANALTDAYYLVLGIPLFTVSLLQTALISALNPILARLKVEDPAGVPEFLGATLLSTVLGLTALGGVMALGVPPLLHLLSSNRPETAALAVQLFYPLLGVIPLAGAGLVLRSVLEIAQVFRVPALLPLLKGIFSLALIAGLRHRAGIYALPLAYLGAELAQLIGYAVAVRLLGHRITWRLTLPAPLRQAFRLILPLALGEAAVNFNVVIDKAFAARLGPGGVSALEYADRVRVIPETALSAGLLTVVFAHWANQVAQGRQEEVRESFDRVARWLTLLLAPSLVALWLVRLEVVQLLFMGGRFGMEAAQQTADVLRGFLPGFLPMMLAILAVKLLLVQGRIRPVVIVGLISLLTNTALDALLMPRLGAPGLSLATSLNQIFIAGLLFYSLRVNGGSMFKPDFPGWFARRIAVAIAIGATLQFGLEPFGLGFWTRSLWVCGVMGGLLAIEARRAFTAWPARQA